MLRAHLVDVARSQVRHLTGPRQHQRRAATRQKRCRRERIERHISTRQAQLTGPRAAIGHLGGSQLRRARRRAHTRRPRHALYTNPQRLHRSRHLRSQRRSAAHHHHMVRLRLLQIRTHRRMQGVGGGQQHRMPPECRQRPRHQRIGEHLAARQKRRPPRRAQHARRPTTTSRQH